MAISKPNSRVLEFQKAGIRRGPICVGYAILGRFPIGFLATVGTSVKFQGRSSGSMIGSGPNATQHRKHSSRSNNPTGS